MKDVTRGNVDDYMRQLKLNGRKTVKWDKNGWNCLMAFTHIIIGRRPRKQGFTFMGLRHFKKV